MYNSTEISAVKLSPTKKDFYQIWNELIDTAGKLSERWDPSATNESDPGVVLLKVLTAIADKLNYNIDANTLEAFIPSAAQESSVRKICDMLGYTMKYYNSATTKARITYHSSAFPSSDKASSIIFIDKFTNLKDIDDTINYVTTESVSISPTQRSVEVLCMEGEKVDCVTENQNIVALHNLDDNHRYYLPESQIAANGIFISNVINVSGVLKSWLTPEAWERVDNLNTREPGAKVYAFGYDSAMGLPYVQFPDDIGSIIGNGLNISYIRTKGNAGNISVNTLYKLEKPASWTTSTTEEGEAAETGDWHNVENYSVTNISPARNGTNPEGIDSAYWNFKKTIGTFDTLVTCRDYMNKIYQLMDESNARPLVSNIIVSDIRDDINAAHTLCTMTDSGTEYLSVSDGIERFEIKLYPFTSTLGTFDKEDFKRSFTYRGKNNIDLESQLTDNKTLAHEFSYPSDGKYETKDEILCIKNYYKLSARINTTYKVSQGEADAIQAVVHKALYKAFNLRNIEFGEEIPYDEILSVMESADSRIKSVGLDDPELRTVIQFVSGKEVQVCPIITDGSLTDEQLKEAYEYYQELVLNNVLAGRIALFNYNTDFVTSYKELPYKDGYYNVPVGEEPDAKTTIKYDDFIYTNNKELNNNSHQVLAKDEKTGKLDIHTVSAPASDSSNGGTTTVTKIIPRFEIDVAAWNESKEALPSSQDYLALEQGEVVQFRLPNFKTTMTYPAYVNYFLKLTAGTRTQQPIPATMTRLAHFLSGGYSWSDRNSVAYLEYYLLEAYDFSSKITSGDNRIITAWEATDSHDTPVGYCFETSGGSPIFYIEENSAKQLKAKLLTGDPVKDTTYYILSLTEDSFASLRKWLSEVAQPVWIWDRNTDNGDTDSSDSIQPSGPRTFLRYSNTTGKSGKYYESGWRYKEVVAYNYDIGSDTEAMLANIFVPILHKTSTDAYTNDGLGQDAQVAQIAANTEYQLKTGEYILFNYSSSDGQSEGIAVPKNEYYGPGTIIKPNFDLPDSTGLVYLKAYNKTSGFGPFSAGNQGTLNAETIGGMFTLGAQEQVEIREPIIVTLDGTATNVYWQLNSDSKEANEANYLFKAANSSSSNSSYSYMLQPGEYFFYTDAVKQDLVYYGAGTELRLKSKNADGTTIKQEYIDATARAFVKSPDSISAEDIVEYGAVSSLPWVSIDLDVTPLDIIEYQYINLTSGDILKAVDLASPEQSTKITRNFQACDGASYVCAGEEATLSNISISGYSWEVASLLNLDMSSEYAQVLTVHQTTPKYKQEILDTTQQAGDTELLCESKIIARTAIDLYGTLSTVAELPDGIIKDDANEELIMVQTITPLLRSYKEDEAADDEAAVNSTVYKAVDMAVYSNKVLTSTGAGIELTSEEVETEPLTFKICETTQLRKSSGALFTPVTGDNLNILTFPVETNADTQESEQLTRNGTKSIDNTLAINCLIPENNFGLIAFYVSSKASGRFSKIKLNYIPYSSAADQLSIFNYPTTDESSSQWWKDEKGKAVDVGVLRNGINIVKVPKAGVINILKTEANTTADQEILYFDNLQLIPNKQFLNPKLGLYTHFIATKQAGNVETSVLEYLAAKDKDIKGNFEGKFYYNNRTSTKMGLDLNEADDKDTLLVAYNWYDPQNVYHKFIVSELDSDSFEDNIRISRFSKL